MKTPARSLYRRGGKRGLDLVLALAGLALAAVPLAVCAAIVRLTSPGPALLAQWRVGRNGRAFRMWKLRTMRAGAEPGGRARFCVPHDGRVTAAGLWLRASHLDELPQLWNIVRGEMSWVGPRPERPVFVARFRREIPDYDRRHGVRPGLTGWAQIHTGYAASLESTRAKTAFDLDYMGRETAAFDLAILLRTAPVVARALNARWGRSFRFKLPLKAAFRL